jgi:MoxR-like ATPase
VERIVRHREEIIQLRKVVRQVPLTREVQSRAIDIVLATHPDTAQASPLAKKYVRYGASPRGAQTLILAGKIFALLDNRYHVARADIDKAALAALRHRIILNFEGEAEGRTSDEIISGILAAD